MDTGRIFGIDSQGAFEECALEIFHYQYRFCVQYRRYCDLMEVSPGSIRSMAEIPFLPIRFSNSTTSYLLRSLLRFRRRFFKQFHDGADSVTPLRAGYGTLRKEFLGGFRHFYGSPESYVILALLPSYLEREGSSLVYMAERLIKESGHPESGYYLYDYDRLYSTLAALKERGQKTLLLGVAFGLLDFLDSYSLQGSGNDRWLTVMETGGMKGRREELSREELHRRISAGFGISSVHSEYGMCELLSQAYSKGDGVFRTPAWMKVIIRDINDPFRESAPGERGIVHIMDLANVFSCSFIETEDTGRAWPDGTFTVEGRLDGAERRGCNMLIE